MIASQEDLPPVEPRDEFVRLAKTQFVAKISENVDRVVISDPLIVIVDERLVHFTDVREGTLSLRDHFLMSEMQIRSYKYLRLIH